jgi:hypothetical protein
MEQLLEMVTNFFEQLMGQAQNLDTAQAVQAVQSATAPTNTGAAFQGVEALYILGPLCVLLWLAGSLRAKPKEAEEAEPVPPPPTRPRRR